LRISQITLTLVVNLIRTVVSAKFICSCLCNPWCDYHVTHTPKCISSFWSYGKLFMFTTRAYKKGVGVNPPPWA